MRDIFYMLSVAVAVGKNLCKILEDFLGNVGIYPVHPDFNIGKSISFDGYPRLGESQ